MRVREYGRPAMTLGVLAAILAAVPPGIALLPHGVGLLRAGAHAEEATAAGDAGDTGAGDATAGTQAAGRQGNVGGSRGSGGVSARQSADGDATNGAPGGGGGSEADVADSAADDDGSGGGGDGGGVSATGESSAAEGGEGFSAGSVEADAPGHTPEVSRRAVSTGTIGIDDGAGADIASEDADTSAGRAGAAAAVGLPAGKTGAGAPAGNVGAGNRGARREAAAPARGEGGGGGALGAAAPEASPAEPARLRVVRTERSADGIAVFYSSQVRERVVDGRYEMQDAGGRLVADRPVTPRDLERMRENVRLSGIGAVSDASLPEGSDVESVVVWQGGMAVRYRAGWTEDLAGDRYRFSDPDGNMVVDRPATMEDRNRLLAIAGG